MTFRLAGLLQSKAEQLTGAVLGRRPGDRGPRDCCTTHVIARRVERAKQLLQTGRDFSQAEVAAHAGCSD